MIDSYDKPGDGADTGEADAVEIQSPEALLAQLSLQTSEVAMFPASTRTTHFFAYDILLDQTTISRFVKGILADKVVRLPHHKLVWPYYYPPRGTGLPSLARTNRPEDEVWGLLYNTRGKDFKELERYLRLPNRYHRVGVRPQDRGGRIFQAFTYILTIADDLPARPSAQYRDELAAAALDRQLPDEWIERIKALEALAEVAEGGA